MAVFARIIELEEGAEQVLLRKTYNDEEDLYQLEVETDFVGGRATFKLSFTEEEVRDAAFVDYSDESAANTRRGAGKMFGIGEE